MSNESETPVILRLPTIFLDFDGVLHGESEVGSRPFNRLPLLEDALGKTDADFQIVISSSWRFHYTLDELRVNLGSLKNFVVGVTPEIRPCSDMRYHEILEVVHAYALEKWIAIDDADWEFPPDCKNLLQCDPRLGFGKFQAEEIQRWFGAIRSNF
jgi:hypothetical protein